MMFVEVPEQIVAACGETESPALGGVMTVSVAAGLEVTVAQDELRTSTV